MNGLDRIIDEIIKEAESEAAKIKAAADEKATVIIKNAVDKADAISEKAVVDAELAYKKLISRAESAGEVAAKRVILQKKQEIIDNVTVAAYKSVLSLAPDKYFGYMIKLLDKYADDKEGVIILNKKDKAHIDKSFDAAIAEHKLKISNECRDIDGGFILVYGDVEENCSISALMEEEKDRLHDAVNELLFG